MLAIFKVPDPQNRIYIVQTRHWLYPRTLVELLTFLGKKINTEGLHHAKKRYAGFESEFLPRSR